MHTCEWDGVSVLVRLPKSLWKLSLANPHLIHHHSVPLHIREQLSEGAPVAKVEVEEVLAVLPVHRQQPRLELKGGGGADWGGGTIRGENNPSRICSSSNASIRLHKLLM